jgi:CrcB protein
VVKLFAQIVLVAIGSAIGGLTRWAVALGAARLLDTAFPWGTLFINLSGSLFLGWFSTVLAERLPPGAQAWWIHPDDLKLLVAVGFTGAYTTFSTFEYESHQQMNDGNYLAAAAYIALSVFLGLVAVRLGVRLARFA